jgi:hypothetical protein
MRTPKTITRRVAVYLDLELDPSHPLGGTMLAVDDATATRAIASVLRGQPFADAFTDANADETWAHLTIARDQSPF